MTYLHMLFVATIASALASVASVLLFGDGAAAALLAQLNP